MASTSEDEEPYHLQCPITKEIMEDPVILIADGHTYERKWLEEWLGLKRTSPLTNQEIDSTATVPNHNLRKAIADFHKRSLRSIVSSIEQQSTVAVKSRRRTLPKTPRRADSSSSVVSDVSDVTARFTSASSLDAFIEYCTKCGSPAEDGCWIIDGHHWHKHCFTCFEPGCKELLSAEDPSCCLKMEDNFYCQSHYEAKMFSPYNAKCEACKQFIQGIFNEIDGKVYHNTCFSCYKCKSALSIDTVYFIQEDARRLCLECHEEEETSSAASRAMKTCADCGLNIRAEFCREGNNFLHRSCFKCYACKSSLEGRSYATYEGYRCGKACNGSIGCYDTEMKCLECTKFIPSGSAYISRNEGFLHSACFTCKGPGCNARLAGVRFHTTEEGNRLCGKCCSCHTCKVSLVGATFRKHEGHDICIPCYLKIAPCHRCKGAFTDSDFTTMASGKRYHDDHYTCYDCDAPLEGGGAYKGRGGEIFCSVHAGGT